MPEPAEGVKGCRPYPTAQPLLSSVDAATRPYPFSGINSKPERLPREDDLPPPPFGLASLKESGTGNTLNQSQHRNKSASSTLGRWHISVLGLTQQLTQRLPHAGDLAHRLFPLGTWTQEV